MERISLTPLSYGLTSPKAQVNIEICHVEWNDPFFGDKIREYFQQGQNVVEKAAEKERVSTSILVDDKRVYTENADLWLRNKCQEVADVLIYVDYIVLESKLVTMLNRFYAIIDDQHQSYVRKEIERYVKRRGRTACSHDIAIWHCMRLGLLGYGDLPVYRIESNGRDEESLMPSFCAPSAMSVLVHNEREYEEQAETDLLSYINPKVFRQSMIKRQYFY